MNRRFLALALAGTLSLSLLAGCGSSKEPAPELSLIHISEPTRRYAISYAVFCLKKKNPS